MTTDTPSSRDEEIPTPRVDLIKRSLEWWRDCFESDTLLLLVDAREAQDIERDLIRLSAEREREREGYKQVADGLDAAVEINNTHCETITQLERTLAERDNQLAEVKAENSGLLTRLVNVENRLEIYEKDRGHHLTEANELRAQLLAAQTVNGKLREALKDMAEAFDSDTARRFYGEDWTMLEIGACSQARTALSLSPDPTLLDEVKREKEELEGKLQAVEPVIVELSQRFKHRPSPDDTWKECLCGQCRLIRSARTALSRLRQSTCETEEKV